MFGQEERPDGDVDQDGQPHAGDIHPQLYAQDIDTQDADAPHADGGAVEGRFRVPHRLQRPGENEAERQRHLDERVDAQGNDDFPDCFGVIGEPGRKPRCPDEQDDAADQHDDGADFRGQDAVLIGFFLVSGTEAVPDQYGGRRGQPEAGHIGEALDIARNRMRRIGLHTQAKQSSQNRRPVRSA